MQTATVNVYDAVFEAAWQEGKAWWEATWEAAQAAEAAKIAAWAAERQQRQQRHQRQQQHPPTPAVSRAEWEAEQQVWEAELAADGVQHAALSWEEHLAAVDRAEQQALAIVENQAVVDWVRQKAARVRAHMQRLDWARRRDIATHARAKRLARQQARQQAPLVDTVARLMAERVEQAEHALREASRANEEELIRETQRVFATGLEWDEAEWIAWERQAGRDCLVRQQPRQVQLEQAEQAEEQPQEAEQPQQPQQPPQAPRQCACCGTALAPLLKCSGCRLVRLCGDECRWRFWPEHKQQCREIRRSRLEFS